MKNLFAVLATFLLIVGCSKKEEAPGSLEVKMAYYFNPFLGYRPDAGANIYLFKETGKTYKRNFIDFRVGSLEAEGTGERVIFNFTAEADATGTARIDNIPSGNYLLIASSKGRRTYSARNIKINAANQTQTKNFGYLYENNNNGEPW